MRKLKDMNAIVSALKFENSDLLLTTKEDYFKTATKLKKLILEINTIYTKTHDPYLLSILRRLQTLKHKVESRSKEPANC